MEFLQRFWLTIVGTNGLFIGTLYENFFGFFILTLKRIWAEKIFSIVLE